MTQVAKQTLNEAAASMTEDQKARARQRLFDDTPKPYEGMSITFYFPDRFPFSPIRIRGSVPHKGEIVWITTHLFDSVDADVDFREHNRWKVKYVHYSVWPPENVKESLLRDAVYRVDVSLVRSRPWYWYKHKLLNLIGYYPLCRWLDKIKRNRRNK